MTDLPAFDMIFLRHGESVGNAESRWQGQADFPLTDKGRDQARSLVGRWQAERRTFDHILTSPLSRACETAEIVGAALNLPVKTDPIWAERDIGEVAGMTSEEVGQRYPRRDFVTPFNGMIDNQGESDWALFLRAGKALHALLSGQPGRYLIVSHGGLLNQLMYAVVGITPHANSSGPRFRFRNTGFAHVVYYPASHRWLIKALNDRAHWAGKDSD